MVLTHVNNFTISGEEDFNKRVIDAVETELTVSKKEDGEFRFTGVDVKETEEGIEISMEECVDSLEKIEKFRCAERTDPLLPSEMKIFRGYKFHCF